MANVAWPPVPHREMGNSSTDNAVRERCQQRIRLGQASLGTVPCGLCSAQYQGSQSHRGRNAERELRKNNRKQDISLRRKKYPNPALQLASEVSEGGTETAEPCYAPAHWQSTAGTVLAGAPWEWSFSQELGSQRDGEEQEWNGGCSLQGCSSTPRAPKEWFRGKEHSGTSLPSSLHAMQCKYIPT